VRLLGRVFSVGLAFRAGARECSPEVHGWRRSFGAKNAPQDDNGAKSAPQDDNGAKSAPRNDKA
jgi:hypothetical protein